jgi:hypothetical protein
MDKVLDLRREALFVDMENSMEIGDALLDPTQAMFVYQWGVHDVSYNVNEQS